MPTPSASDASLKRYSTVSIILHWTIATLLVANVAVGINIDSFKGLAKFSILQWHKSIGVTVLILTLLRFAWRLVNKPPPYPAHMPGWEKAAAHLTHWAFYFLLLGIPLTGWVMVSASPLNIPTLLYKTIPWPHIGLVHGLPIAERKNLEHLFGFIHENLARATVVLSILHVLAALRHQFSSRDEVLWRMIPLPFLKPAPVPAAKLGKEV